MSFCEPYHQEYYSGYLDILIEKIVVKVTRETVDATMKLILIALWCLTGKNIVKLNLNFIILYTLMYLFLIYEHLHVKEIIFSL